MCNKQVVSQLAICILFLTTHFNFFALTCIPASENLPKNFVTFFFTFSFIALMSLMPNPHNKPFSISMLVRSFLNKIENHLLFLIRSLQEFYKIFEVFFILPRFNVSLVPPRLWNGSQLTLQTAHFYSTTHFISVSTNPASFPNSYRILFFHFFQVDVSEIEMPTKKIILILSFPLRRLVFNQSFC